VSWSTQTLWDPEVVVNAHEDASEPSAWDPGEQLGEPLAAIMNSPASSVTARTGPRPRSAGAAGYGGA
jgi:hypothetical protein